METVEKSTEEMMLEDSFNLLKNAFALLSSPSISSREISLTLTKLEETMMWLNKARTIKGYLNPTATHVQKDESNKSSL